MIPNLRDAQCCQYCKHGNDDIRCGCNMGYRCRKHREDVSETSICDDYEVWR